MTLKIVTILGARPQFIKAAPVSRAIAEHNRSVSDSSAAITELIVNTGQHYDRNMSQVFFEEMQIHKPIINLGIGSGHHGKQTGEMLIRIEEVLQKETPDWVLVYGDTNSTLAGALAAAKLHISVAHVEAGLRSYNREMPEEHNRVLTDHCANLLLCPSQTAVDNLKKEGIEKGVHLVGDTMYDAVLQFSEIAKARSNILGKLDIKPSEYYLATVHRPYNTDNPKALKEILSAFLDLNKPVVFPVHPRTRQRIMDSDLASNLFTQLNRVPVQGVQPGQPQTPITMIDPVGYLDMLCLENSARMILTDSGGMQKEAYFLGVPCITLRPETEWVETVQSGWNVLVEANKEAIIRAVTSFQIPDVRSSLYGDGKAGKECVRVFRERDSA